MIIEWAQFLENGLPIRQKKASVTVGVFDGVHRGHRSLIERVVSHDDYVSVAFCVSRDDKKMGNGGQETGNIQTLQEKTQMLLGLGLNILVLINFDESFRHIPGNDFLEILLKHMDIGFFAVGSDFRCGYNLDTDAAAIHDFFSARRIPVEIVPEVMEGGLPISSSRIRAALAAGDFSAAGAMLGREWHRTEKNLNISGKI